MLKALVEKHLPKEYRQKAPWRHVAAELAAAVKGADPADVSIALRLALSRPVSNKIGWPVPVRTNRDPGA